MDKRFVKQLRTDYKKFLKMSEKYSLFHVYLYKNFLDYFSGLTLDIKCLEIDLTEYVLTFDSSEIDPDLINSMEYICRQPFVIKEHNKYKIDNIKFDRMVQTMSIKFLSKSDLFQFQGYFSIRLDNTKIQAAIDHLLRVKEKTIASLDRNIDCLKQSLDKSYPCPKIINSL